MPETEDSAERAGISFATIRQVMLVIALLSTLSQWYILPVRVTSVEESQKEIKLEFKRHQSEERSFSELMSRFDERQKSMQTSIEAIQVKLDKDVHRSSK